MELLFDVPARMFIKSINKAVLEIASKINIPGFRKGKAPRHILENYLGKNIVLQEAYRIAGAEIYADTLRKERIDAIGQPKFELIEMKDEFGLKFKAIVTLKPDVVLGNYKELNIEKKQIEVTEEDVEKYINDLRTRFAKVVVCSLETKLAKGHTGVIDFKGFIEDKPFTGGEAKAYSLEIGSNAFVPNFEEQLIGMKAGEQRIVNVKFPQGYHIFELVGKEAKFEVMLHTIKEKEFPELNNEFAKEVADFETMAEFREDVNRTLKENAAIASQKEFDKEAIRTVIDNSFFEIPQEMVDNRVEQLVYAFSTQLKQQGVNLDKYLEYTKSSLESFNNQQKDIAIEQLKYELVMDALVKAENIEIKEKEIAEQLEKIAQAHKLTTTQSTSLLRKKNRFNEVRTLLLRRKAHEFIVKQANFIT